MSRRTAGALAAVSVMLRLATQATAASPLVVTTDGTPWKWSAFPIHYKTDLGGLGSLDNATVTATVVSSFAAWAAIATATVSSVRDGDVGIDVTADNYAGVVANGGACGDGLTPIVYDTDGSLMDALYGAGAHLHAQGITQLCGIYATGEITQGEIIINDDAAVSLPRLTLVATHEIGHLLGLAHTQTNVVEAIDKTAADDGVVPVMMPSGDAGTISPDDRAIVSALYPSPSFATTLGSITGHVFLPDGHTPFAGAFVIARKTDDPRATAVGAPSGARYWLQSPGGGPLDPSLVGLYELPGLPPGQYTVEMQSIQPRIAIGYDLSPPPPLPGPPEFWNGPREGASAAADDPTDSVPVTVSAGGMVTNVDFVINDRPAPDDCANPRVLLQTPILDVIDTTGATVVASDPTLSCTAGFDVLAGHSVWYRFTAPTTGRVRALVEKDSGTTPPIETNDFWLVSIHAGACGALDELACTGTPQGVLEATADLSAGETVLLEYTGRGSSLNVKIDFAACGTSGAPACPPTTTTTTTLPPPPCAGLTPLPAARCAVGGVDVDALCAPELLDARLAQALRAGLKKTSSLLARAANAKKSRQLKSLLRSADRALATLLPKVALAEHRHKVHGGCRDAIDAAIAGLRAAVGRARAGTGVGIPSGPTP